MKVHNSALKREYTEDDIRHALEHVYISYDVIDETRLEPGYSDSPRREPWVEMIVLRKAREDLVIHCMKARKGELDKALRITRGRY